MSYNVAVVLPPVPDDDKAAWAALDAFTAEQGPRPAVFQALHDRLTALYPCLSTLDDDEVDDSAWSDGPLINNFLSRAAVLGLSPPRVEEVLPVVIRESNALGLVVFDWATGTVHRPPSRPPGGWLRATLGRLGLGGS